jgi:multidrug resistance protein MdtO
VWPVSVCRRVDPALAAAFRQLAKAVSAKGLRERRLLVSQVQGALKETETDIELADYEPASIRSSPAWLCARRQVVANSQSLSSLLLLSAYPSELSRVEAVTRLNRMATRLAEPTNAQQVPSRVMESAHGWQTLPARVNRRLWALEEILTPGVGDTEANPHAPA